ncbi:MAG TPA: hypothetical protein VN722_03925 [Hanamia sp.]|nr:hypothetical protein [Hanamia sp.]
MKWMLLLSGVIFFSSCGLRQREMELDKKMNELNQREQELTLKEQSLSAKEIQLNEREKRIDSSKRIVNDTLFLEHKIIPGIWMVEMQCTETTCSGSAVGDIKNEQWDFKFQDNVVIASAMSNNQLVRVYTGAYFGNLLKLSVQQDSTETSARINIRLTQTKEKEMEGEREIIQANGCHILYSLRLKKQ